MHATTTCCDDPCGCEESAFARVRYAYGQRLTAIDLLDEQAYLIAKDRFVARHHLGAGVVCGLRARRDDGPPGRTPAIRVTRGAALDLCGREVVVEHDQCLDVGAWFARRRDALHWNAGTHPAWIGLRYLECPSDPVRVPGDACGCDGDGCEYTRVREGFELALHAGDGPVAPGAAPATWSQPCRAPERCPPCRCDEWLLIAGLDVVVTVAGAGAGLRASDVTGIDDADPRRLELQPVAALQRTLLDLPGAAEACGPGPRLDGLTGDGDVDDAGALTAARAALAVSLAPDDGGVPVALAAATVAADRFRLAEVGAAGWADVTAQVAYDGPASAFRLTSDAVELDRPYRLSFSDDPAAPIADEQLRPLRPATWSRVVRWVVPPDEPGTVVLRTT